MTKRTAKLLWESILIHNTPNPIMKELKLSKPEVRVFLSHSMPEMFVEKEINDTQKKRTKELEEIANKLIHEVKRKKSSNISINIGIIIYLIITIPVLIILAILIHL